MCTAGSGEQGLCSLRSSLQECLARGAVKACNPSILAVERNGTAPDIAKKLKKPRLEIQLPFPSEYSGGHVIRNHSE